MNILTICSALNNYYIGIKFNDKIYTEIIKSDENYHSLYLISKIKELFILNNLSMKELNLIGVNTGPGSFTGIRVALSIAKTIASELNLPLVNLTTPEILLTAFNNCDLLLMDARRDMYFVCSKENTELLLKDKIQEKISNKKLITDKRCSTSAENSICFEEIDKNLSETMIELTEEKYLATEDKTCFNYLKIEANYIQTPPIF